MSSEYRRALHAIHTELAMLVARAFFREKRRCYQAFRARFVVALDRNQTQDLRRYD